MGAFEYKAVDKLGREKRGLLEGDTARQVRQQLRERGLLPLDVSEVAAEQGKKSVRQIGVRRGISAADLALVTRQLATLVRSGLPLEEALQAVSEQNDTPRVQSVLMGVRSRVMEGHSLANGFADFPHAFPEIYRATVAAGEQSGHLDGPQRPGVPDHIDCIFHYDCRVPAGLCRTKGSGRLRQQRSDAATNDPDIDRQQ
jgi:general secretion pathway protein F